MDNFSLEYRGEADGPLQDYRFPKRLYARVDKFEADGRRIFLDAIDAN